MGFFKALFLRNRFFIAAIAVVAAFVVSYVWPVLFPLAVMFLVLLSVLILVDIILLFRIKKAVFARREMADKFSNGDENPVDIYLEHFYPQKIHFEIIDELPFQFQKRDTKFELSLDNGEAKNLRYNLRPVKRGEYQFGAVNVFVRTHLGLAARRFRFDAQKTVPVYPSYLLLRQYELLAISNHLQMMGIKKIRRIGHNKEFEQIEDYVAGDDFRRINWKATARTKSLKVNHYQDERSQNVYSLIDKGRVMKMPFDGMSLLDYAINASLVISNVAIRKGDKAGLVTFQNEVNSIVPASSRNRQMQLISEQLFKEKTSYKESDYAKLYAVLRHKLNQRSLLILYTNFESIHSLQRQLKYFRLIAKRHLLLCIFFQNTEVENFAQKRADSIEEIYEKGIAEQLLFEKQLIVKELQNHGIQTLLTAPEDLTVNTINKYLELKGRGLI